MRTIKNLDKEIMDKMIELNDKFGFDFDGAINKLKYIGVKQEVLTIKDFDDEEDFTDYFEDLWDNEILLKLEDYLDELNDFSDSKFNVHFTYMNEECSVRIYPDYYDDEYLGESVESF